jgi:isoleucyl-tRNA synthetase
VRFLTCSAPKALDAWYIKEPSEFLPADVACECGGRKFTKETDIMDVWFDSGVSHAAVIDEREELCFPADLYLEGADTVSRLVPVFSIDQCCLQRRCTLQKCLYPWLGC